MSLTDSCVGLRHRGSTGANNPENQDVKELQSEEASIPEKVNLNKHDAHLDTKGETEMCVFQSKKVNTGEDAAESNEIDNLISKSSEPTKPDVIYIEEENDENDHTEVNIGCIAQNVVDQTEELVRNIWNVCSFHALPKWLQDNNYLHNEHRPPLNSFIECCKSVFRLHTETVNIWTHLIGCFIFMALYIHVLLTEHYAWQDKLIFAVYFLGTIVCLGLSTAFHVVHCHSESIGKLFNKLDYCGITVLIMVSFVPWLYYAFYCRVYPILIYLSSVLILGTASIIMSLQEKFSRPAYRPIRTAVFTTFGLSGVVPAMHYLYVEFPQNKVALGTIGWLILMGSLYIAGALIYILRIPERIFPGKCDIFFQSHQIFHVFVLVAAFTHYYGITRLASYTMMSVTANTCFA